MAKGTQYFSQLEMSLLTELVRKHKDLVENKKNNYKTTQQKIKRGKLYPDNSIPRQVQWNLHKTVALSLRLILGLKLQAQSSNMQLAQA